jgi:DNA-binding GntR family transcriptional regulator
VTRALGRGTLAELVVGYGGSAGARSRPPEALAAHLMDQEHMTTSWFPARLADAVPALLAAEPLDAAAGYAPAWGEDWVAARPPTSAEAREFGIKRGMPVIVVHARRMDAADTVIEYAELTARSDARVAYRYEFLPEQV